VHFNKTLRDIAFNKNIKDCAPIGCSTLEQQYNLFSKLYPYYIKKGVELCNSNQQELEAVFADALEVAQSMLFQSDYTFSFEKAGVYETKNFTLLKEKSILLDFPEIYYPISIIINELLVRPNLAQFHTPTLVLIRRLYYYFPDIRSKLSHALVTLFTNIAIFGTDDSKKQAAIFLYQLIHKDRNEEVSRLVSGPSTPEQPSTLTSCRRLQQAALAHHQPQALQRAGSGVPRRSRESLRCELGGLQHRSAAVQESRGWSFLHDQLHHQESEDKGTLR